MITIQAIRDNKELVIKRLAIKGIDAKSSLELILNKDDLRRQVQTQLDNSRNLENQLAAAIGMLFKSGKADEAESKKNEVATQKDKSKQFEIELSNIESEIKDLLIVLPNTPSLEVPNGKTPDDNIVVLQNGTMPELADNALPHWELAKKYDLIDFELGVKLSGAGFPVYKGYGARLQRGLINFFLDQARNEGYLEIQPPILVNEDSAYATGQLPDKEGQMYYMPVDNYYLIPTAEVPITNIYRDTILKQNDLPIKNAGYTPCFRREAGSYGKDVRGLNRLHQFDKVEIVQISDSENSYKILEEMQTYVQSLLQKLELPYRVLKLCGGDMSFASALTYDMEVFSAAQKRWLEVSSVSNFETFQSNRLKLRYKDQQGKIQLAHTLNGSALALPRIVAALLENNQSENGILIPKILIPYVGFDIIQ